MWQILSFFVVKFRQILNQNNNYDFDALGSPKIKIYTLIWSTGSISSLVNF